MLSKVDFIYLYKNQCSKYMTNQTQAFFKLNMKNFLDYSKLIVFEALRINILGAGCYLKHGYFGAGFLVKQ